SLLNNNVSFDSSMEHSMATDATLPKLGADAMSSLSFSLSETERQKLQQLGPEAAASGSGEKQPEEASEANGSCMEASGDLEGSTLYESEPTINIEDTLDESPALAAAHELSEHSTATVVPPQLTYFGSDLVELGRRCWTSSAQQQHYTKGCYWSPDGTCLLVAVHLDGMHVAELPLDLYNASSVSTDRSLSKLQSAVHVPEGGTVYDCVWYPLMSSQDPTSCFWLATRQHEPIHMWDAFDGQLRCSYRGYDAVDEVVAAISLAFSHDGQKIYGGYKRSIKIFSTSRPGRTYDEYPVKTAISCFAQTTEHAHTVTCGNWKGYIQHFDLRSSPAQGPLFTLGGHAAGITQLRYAHTAAGSWQLFSGARRCPKLLQWDMRNYKQPLQEYLREVHTNQRIQFDLTPQQSWLASGGTDGALSLWDLQQEHATQSMKLPLHGDCCNGVSFNPILPVLATTSGQYHFISGDSHENTFSTTISQVAAEEQQRDENMEVEQELELELELEQHRTVDYENAVLLLWCGNTS
ncbi:hypothetical protein KR222_002880, partial [Zaprionus bogoriensis]